MHNISKYSYIMSDKSPKKKRVTKKKEPNYQEIIKPYKAND